MMTKPLTILLTLWDRPEFNIRALLSYSALQDFASLYVADGSKNKSFPDLIKGMAGFESIVYQDCGVDNGSTKGLFEKIYRALLRIRSPYCVLYDNDDLLVREGLLAAIERLEADHTVLSARGEVAGFYLENNGPNGLIKSLEVPLSFRYRPYESKVGLNKLGRVKHKISQGITADWYNVYRTSALLSIFEQLLNFDFRCEATLPEFTFQIISTAMGEHVHIDRCVQLFRQQETSLRYKMKLQVPTQEDILADLNLISSYLGELVEHRSENGSPDQHQILGDIVHRLNSDIAWTIENNRNVDIYSPKMPQIPFRSHTHKCEFEYLPENHRRLAELSKGGSLPDWAANAFKKSIHYFSSNGNPPLEPRGLEVEFFPKEEVLHEKVKIYR